MERDSTTINSEIPFLVQNARKKPEHFDQLYFLFVRQVYAYIYGMVKNQQDAEDITADAFISAATSIDTLNNIQKFPSWLFRIARNKTMDFFRNNRKKQEFNFYDEADLENLVQPVSGDPESRLLINSLLKKLPGEDRELILMKYFADLTFVEIAEVLRLPLSTVKHRIYRILKEMNDMLEV